MALARGKEGPISALMVHWARSLKSRCQKSLRVVVRARGRPSRFCPESRNSKACQRDLQDGLFKKNRRRWPQRDIPWEGRSSPNQRARGASMFGAVNEKGGGGLNLYNFIETVIGLERISSHRGR